MTPIPLSADDYPISEKRPELVLGARGMSLNELTLETVLSGEVTMEDLRITPEALLYQAEIARSVGRIELARNFERASEMSILPQEIIIEIYELMRPGRAESKESFLAAAKRLRDTYNAENLAAYLEEAAEIYEQRSLFASRF